VRTPSFEQLRVLTLESRRGQEMATLVSNYGGHCTAVPALREIPIDTNVDALRVIDALVGEQVDLLILLTGVGTRAMLDVVDRLRDRATFVSALARTRIAARGPKPVAVLRELGLTPWLVAPEPNTWRELIGALDHAAGTDGLRGQRVAVQEYGASNTALLEALATRGAQVTRVPVYRWALPDDVAPLVAAARAIAAGEVDVLLLTTAMQFVHLLQVADDNGLASDVVRGLGSTVIASIGPTTTEALRERGLEADLEATHPKMGFLVREAAAQAHTLVQRKRGTGM
jgi:uroporphyrinogen-III synthase